jgi:hypothetical protein
MTISFKSIVQIYLVVLMFISLLFIVDRMTERQSKPIVVGNELNPVVLVIKKGCIFRKRTEKL